MILVNTLLEKVRFNIRWASASDPHYTGADDAINRMTPLELLEACSEALEEILREREDTSE